MAKNKQPQKQGDSVLDGLGSVQNDEGDLTPDLEDAVIPNDPSPEMIARENARTAALRAEAKKDGKEPPKEANERVVGPDEEVVKVNRAQNVEHDDVDPVGESKPTKATKITTAPKEPILYFSKYIGLRIGIEPATEYYEEIGPGRKRKVTIPGKKIVFKDGRFATMDPIEINFLNKWMMSHQGEVYTTNPEVSRLARAVARIKAEDAAAKRKGAQGVVGGS